MAKKVRQIDRLIKQVCNLIDSIYKKSYTSTPPREITLYVNRRNHFLAMNVIQTHLTEVLISHRGKSYAASINYDSTKLYAMCVVLNNVLNVRVIVNVIPKPRSGIYMLGGGDHRIFIDPTVEE